jgi:hypothetical protein
MRIFLLFVLLFFSILHGLIAQKLKMEMKPGDIVEEFTPEKSGIIRKLPEDYYDKTLAQILEKASKKSLATQIPFVSTSEFIVTYEVPPPANVKAVFEQAAATWANFLKSDVPIRIYVKWRPLATGVLGSAGAYSSVRNFVGANKLNTWYPIALAEKMAHANLNGGESDIIATFNSEFPDWFIGTNGVPTSNQIDLYSVVLHEMGHGLGFIGQIQADVTSNSTSLSTAGYGYPGIFDQFIFDSKNRQLVDTLSYKNNSNQIFKQIISDSLYLSSTAVLRNNSNKSARLYAPKPTQRNPTNPLGYIAGSSVYHVDQNTYPPGNLNALMTPQIARGEITPQLGPVVKGIFNDIGWYSSNIIDAELKDTEENQVLFSAKVYSDTLWDEKSLKLMYSIDKSILSATPITSFTKTGSNTYSYLLSLPKSVANRKVSYYWTASELSGKKFTSPAEAPVIAGTKFGSYNEFVIGVDTVKPIVVYSNPLKYVFTSQTNIPLPTLLASDNLGIDTIYMEYAINGAALKGQGFKKLAGDTYSYSNAFNFLGGTLKSGDVVKYRITVRDKAKIANTVNLPSSGFYEFKVLGILASTKSYVSNFDQSPDSDFYLKGFDISQPKGFSSPSLNSVHPYADGLEESYDGGGGSDKFTNNDAVLLKPIIIRSDTAKIYFDEVALVEPGNQGEAFLNVDGTVNRSFFDYVIVQGSNDLGKTWSNFTNGWDANAYSIWQNAWNSKTDKDGNSTAVATPSLLKKREIDMLASGKFKAGDQVIIRFRLHADVGAHGWGWWIDNLNIQGSSSISNPILAIEPGTEIRGLQVSPNPSTGHIFIEMPLLAVGNLEKEIHIGLSDMMGKMILAKKYSLTGDLFKEELDLSALGQGTYLLQVQTGDKLISRKIVLIK